MNTKPSFSYGIKGKLISAVSMLLVAVIMVVSSTYAWFTLSTAPEVTGISTAIGANGALEIKLDGATTTHSPKNTTWGNLVDLENPGYGLQDIILLPSAMNTVNNAGAVIVRNNPLMYPQYGADGRPMDTLSPADIGKYSGTAFKPLDSSDTDTRGVLAVGKSSGMTARQQAFRDARSAAGTAMTSATLRVEDSLIQNGGVLAQIVVNHIVSPTGKTTAAQLQSLDNIVTALEAALAQIEIAYEQQIIAVSASEKATNFGGSMSAAIAESFYVNVQNAIKNDTITLQKIKTDGSISLTVDNTAYSYNLQETPLLASIEHYLTINTDVAAARTALNTMKTGEGGTYVASDWTNVKTVIDHLIDYSKAGQVSVNNIDINGADQQALVNAISSNGFKVNLVLAEGSGVYESLADQCGNFDVDVLIPTIEYSGFTITNFEAKIATQSNTSPAHLKAASDAVQGLGAPSGTVSADTPLTEFYGYILDFIFQTNASGSNLLLQTEPADRIYDDNDNPETQGGGSTMTFKSTLGEKNFSNDQVKKLMGAVRVVFFDVNGNILKEARLDIANATVDENGVTAKLYIYDAAKSVTKYFKVAPAAGEGNPTEVEVFKKAEDEKYYTTSGYTAEVTLLDGERIETRTTNAFIGDDEGEKALLTNLDQNQEKKVSVLVFLDGADLENKDVAYTGETSVTGKLNLQFASDANLIPMEYGALHQPVETPVTPPESDDETT